MINGALQIRCFGFVFFFFFGGRGEVVIDIGLGSLHFSGKIDLKSHTGESLAHKPEQMPGLGCDSAPLLLPLCPSPAGQTRYF